MLKLIYYGQDWLKTTAVVLSLKGHIFVHFCPSTLWDKSTGRKPRRVTDVISMSQYDKLIVGTWRVPHPTSRQSLSYKTDFPVRVYTDTLVCGIRVKS